MDKKKSDEGKAINRKGYPQYISSLKAVRDSLHCQSADDDIILIASHAGIFHIWHRLEGRNWAIGCGEACLNVFSRVNKAEEEHVS